MDEDVKGSSDFAVVSADTGVKTSGDNLDAEGLAIAQHLLAKGGKRKLIDASFHRYAHNDDPMPTWFEDEEWVHKQIAVPITKETVNQIKAAQAEIAARPVKKVREAKAKKKMRALRKMEKVKSQALAISENTMMTGIELKCILRDLNLLQSKRRPEILHNCTRRQRKLLRSFMSLGVCRSLSCSKRRLM